jgi:hypothetical protein
MTEFGDQNDSDHEAAEINRRSFSWVAGVVVLAIILGLVVGVDHGRTVVSSNDSATAAMMVLVGPTAIPGPRPVTPNRL